MFNATEGYLNDPYEAQRSVACMHQQHSEFKQGSCKTESHNHNNIVNITNQF